MSLLQTLSVSPCCKGPALSSLRHRYTSKQHSRSPPVAPWQPCTNTENPETRQEESKGANMKGVWGVTSNFMPNLHRDREKGAEMWDATGRESAANFLMQKTHQNTSHTDTLPHYLQTLSQTGASGPGAKATKGTNTMGVWGVTFNFMAHLCFWNTLRGSPSMEFNMGFQLE